MFGKLSIVASADLGGLGAREGPPVEYTLIVPGMTLRLLPWLLILALLMLKSNRCAAAWLIWLPMIFVAVVLQTVVSPLLPSDANPVLDAAMALVLGFAVVWLLADRLRWKHRSLTFLCVLLMLAVGGGLTLLLQQGLGREVLPVGFLLGVALL